MKTALLHIVLVGMLAVSPAFAQDSLDGDVPRGVASLVAELRELGWPEAEIAELRAEIPDSEAQAFEDAPAEVVALALAFVRERSNDTGAAERAGLALELAEVASAMAATGFTRLEIGRAALEGTRDALAERDVSGAGGPADRVPAGEAIRERVVSRIRDQVRAIAGGRGPDVVRTILDRLDRPRGTPAPVTGTPDVPGGGPGGPDL
ncbi:MAG: hypothetical protein ACOC1U_07730 [Spirochaetota bacterium]